MVSAGVIKTSEEEEEEEGWSWSKLKSKCLHIWRNITVEPVVIFYCLVVALSGIPGEEMYVKKACLVNLNHTREVCDNIYDHKEIQLETQKLVSGLQAKSGILKSVPGIVFILFAGPLSDSYGRKLFLLLSLFGYISLNIVFLVNSIWFMELRVEYLLLECLQEVTGGSTMFYLSAKAYLCDITTPEERTTRMAVADAFMSIGWLVGMPAGTRIKKNFGYTALFATTLAIAVTGFLYTLIFLKDSVKLLSEEQRKAYYERKKKEAITCDTGVVGNSFGLVLSSFKALFKKRNKNNRLWIIMFVLIFALPTVVNAGYGVVGYLFYRLQYNISTETYSDLISAWFVVNMFAQLVTVPFLSNKLGLQDTTIILLAIGPAVLGFFAEAWRTEVRHDSFFHFPMTSGLGSLRHLDRDVPPLLQHLHDDQVRCVQAGGAGGGWQDLHHHRVPRVHDAAGGEADLRSDLPGHLAHPAQPLVAHHVHLPRPHLRHRPRHPHRDGEGEEDREGVGDD